MASPKGRTKSFDDFRGIDLFASHLSRQPNFATDFQNFVVTSRKSARGRSGHKIVGQRYFPVGTDARLYCYPRGGLSAYSYPNGGGGTERQLVGLGQWAYRYALREATLRISLPVGASFHFLPTDIGGGTYRMVADCRINGVTVGGLFPMNCGTGNETTATMVTLEALEAAIDGLGGGWGAVLTPWAKINGAQLARSHIVPITVDAGHTISQGGRVECEITSGPAVIRSWFDVLAVGATTITLKDATNPTYAWDVPDNGGIGVGMYSACILPFTEVSRADSGATATISFGYWQGVQTAPMVSVFMPSMVDSSTGNQVVPRECANVLYYGTDKVVFTDTNNGSIKSGLIKYDGRECYVAGMPQCPLPTLGALGAGLLGIGRYKYLAEYIYIDTRGNEIHGNASDLLGEATITPGAASTIGVTVAQVTDTAFNHHSAQLNTGGAPIGPTNIIPVVPATCTLRQGDWIYIYDSTGVLHYRRVDQLRYDTTYPALNAVEVQISGANITVTDVAPYNIISNILIRIWRSKVGGSFYYRLFDMLNDPASATQTYPDTIADTGLGEEWGGPYTGRDRRDMPPRTRLIEPHQGLLAGAGDPDFPVTIFWSNYESAEYWSRSTNYQELLSTRLGGVTALASDQLDTLIAFKTTSYSVISGDLFEGAFSLTSEVRGDVGCPAANGWQKVREAIIFMSKKGPRSIVGGQLANFDDRLTSFFNRDSKLYIEELNGARSLLYPGDCLASLNDEGQMKLYFDVPFIPDAGASYIWRRFVFDYQKNLWSVFTLPSDYFGIGGLAVFDESHFMLGGSNISNSPCAPAVAMGVEYPYSWSNFDYTGTSWYKYAYIDGVNAIPKVFRPQWEFIDDPSTDKEFHTLKIWSLDPAPFISFTLGVKSYRNFRYDTVDTEATLAFSAESTIDGEVPLVLNRAKSLQISFENKTRFECPHITGYEIQVAMPYDKEELEGNDQ